MSNKTPTPLFGPSGTSQRFYDEGGKTTLEALPWVANLGLNAYEYSFGRGVNMGEDTARAIGQAVKANKLTLSVHGPYYINLNNTDKEKLATNLEWFTKACTAAQWMGADRVIFHPGSTRGGDRAEALAVAAQNLQIFITLLRDAGLLEGISLCPETMGKVNQLGNLDEMLELCQVDKCVVPCIDFGHLHAASQGALNCDEAAQNVLDTMEKALGKVRCRNFHMHFS
ncbi:MAG: TIM barrel protein, partial [Clostridia bacterium]|nr:TIM barrel protein [Clostridia bacterium]